MKPLWKVKGFEKQTSWRVSVPECVFFFKRNEQKAHRHVHQYENVYRDLESVCDTPQPHTRPHTTTHTNNTPTTHHPHTDNTPTTHQQHTNNTTHTHTTHTHTAQRVRANMPGPERWRTVPDKGTFSWSLGTILTCKSFVTFRSACFPQDRKSWTTFIR